MKNHDRKAWNHGVKRGPAPPITCTEMTCRSLAAEHNLGDPACSYVQRQGSVVPRSAFNNRRSTKEN